jgi:hypothetical protein
MENLIKNWLSLHEDHIVEIEGYGGDTIIARNDIDCKGNFIKIEYVSIEHGCPCCEGNTYTYYTFDEIDLAKGVEILLLNDSMDCVLRFNAADGRAIKDYYVADGSTKCRLKYESDELSEQDVNDFFDKDWSTTGQWSEGEGRAQTHYEIMCAGRMTIIAMTDFGFDDFHTPKYFLINNQ